MKVKLGILDRVQAVSLLPKQGNFFINGLVDKFEKQIMFSEEEFKKYGIKFAPSGIEGQTNVSYKSEFAKDIDIGDIVYKLLNEKILSLNSQKKLDRSLTSLIEKLATKETMDKLNSN